MYFVLCEGKTELLSDSAKQAKETTGFATNVCFFIRPSVRPSACNNTAYTLRVFEKFAYREFLKASIEQNHFVKLGTKITGPLTEYLPTFTTY